MRPHLAPSAPQSTASVDPSPDLDSQQQQQWSHFVSLNSLPLEITRRILLHLRLTDIPTLSAVSRRIRELFRPADHEVQFAADHLLEHFPPLRGNEDSDSDSDDSEESEQYYNVYGEEKENGRTQGSGSDHSSDYDYDDEFDDDESESEWFGHDHLDDDDKSESSEDDQSSKRKTYYEANYMLRKHVKLLRRLPLCYSLAVLKLEDFDEDAFRIIARPKTWRAYRRIATDLDRAWKLRDVEEQGRLAFLERLLLFGVCELEMCFETAEYEWEGRWYRRKEVNDEIRSWVGKTGSIEAARRIVEIEKKSVTMLPVGHEGKKCRDRHEKKSRLWGEGEPTNVSESIQRFALKACIEGAVLLLQFLFDTYPVSFTNLAERRARCYLSETFYSRTNKNREQTIRTLVDCLNRSQQGHEHIAADSGRRYNPLLSPFVSLTETDADRIPKLSLLESATSCNDISMVRLLLELGADPNFMDPVLAFGGEYSSGRLRCDFPGDYDPALHVACESWNPNAEIIMLLVEHGADPLLRNWEGDTALNVCLDHEGVQALVKAVERHAPQALDDLLAVQSPGKGNALHQSIRLLGKEQHLMVLLEAIKKRGLSLRKAVFSAQDSQKLTVLNKACQYNNGEEDAAHLVLDAMMDGVHLHTTAFRDMREVLLVDDDDGFTPVHVAAMFGWEKLLRKMLEVLSAVNDGLCEKVLRMEAGKTKRTPLQLATRKGHAACVRMVLEHGRSAG
ncbi:Transient receptor putative cation channel sub A member 1 [Phlyctochytrium bullatum]|nr:Transient receptor putative cation channel sub A member 1 [Phlyctochytrium bullatum]